MQLSNFYKLISQHKRVGVSLNVFKHRPSKTIRLEILTNSGVSQEVDLTSTMAESLARDILKNIGEITPNPMA